MTDQYHGWRELLDGRKFPIQEDKPLCGFWRKRDGKDGPWQRVAIWTDGDMNFATVNKAFAYPDDLWLWCARNPISEADYRHHEKHGVWPGEVVAPIGHNRPDDPYQALCEDAEDAIKDAADWLAVNAVTDQRTADMAGNKVSLIRDLVSKGESAHRTEKAPHLEAGRAVDTKYLPLVKRLSDAATALKSAVTQWAAAERTRFAEERRKAEAERVRIEAENRRREADAKAALQPPPEPVALPPLPEGKIQAGGQVGRKLGFRVEEKAVVTDYAKAFKKYKDHPDVVSLIDKLVQQAFKATGKLPPGCEIREETRAA